jgi:L-aspartate oxidase
MRRKLQRVMDRDAGVLRSEDSLHNAMEWMDALLADTGSLASARPCTEDWETTNLVMISYVLVSHALLREETRGSHWREDFPDTSDMWQVRLVSRVDGVDELITTVLPVRAAESMTESV